MAFTGPGLGGHCIPIDPFYLTWKARQYGVNTRFIELAGEVNAAMPEWVVGKVADALNDRSKAVRGSRILVLGIAYSDPHVPRFPKMRAHAFDLESTALTVTRESNPRYYALIEAFRALSGVPMVLNTSFNENEPVVCRPEEALDCFLRTKMDVLVMGGGLSRGEGRFRHPVLLCRSRQG